MNEHFPKPAPEDETHILILDDLMKESAKDTRVMDAFTTWSHHKAVTVFLITQNLYHQGRHSVDIGRNISNAMFIVE